MTGSSLLSNPSLLSVILAALSHELGSPLAAIKGAATTLIDYRDRLPDDSIEGFLHSIDSQTDQLNDLLDDLVLMAKMQAGTVHLHPEPIALRDLLDQVIAQLPPDHHCHLKIEGSDPLVRADLPYLRHALALLLQQLRHNATAQTIIRLEVKDTARMLFAIQIDPESFDPVALIEQLRASSDPGRGRQAVNLLRLALSRAVIELHGGTWVIEQPLGEEPALGVTFPLADHRAESD